MTNQVTRCPQCRTSFRITAGQIAKARGAVRCGSCLHIFNAEQHRIDADARRDRVQKAKNRRQTAPEPPPQQTRLAIDSEPTPEPDPSSSGLNFDQAQIDAESGGEEELISDDMDRADDDNPLFIDETPAAGVSLFERQPREPAEEFVDDSDESWAESLLEEDDDPPRKEPPGRDDNPLSITHSDESDESPGEPQTPRTEPPNEAAEPPEPRFHLAEPEPDEADTSPGDAANAFFSEKMRAYDSERSELLLGIDPDPVEMTGRHAGPWRWRLIWGGLCLLALAALVAQIGWLQFDRLSRIDPYRGYYQMACQWLGCELPERRDISQIRAYNLVVRDHPERADALIVDAIILNRAEFDQPYPDLRLTFTDMSDEPVATRRFTPDEYLGGELAGSTIMPHNRPVHLTLELVDPGENAVNYRLEVL